MNTKITFINESWDDNKSKVVLFQRNVATDLKSTTTAWRVIEHCGYKWRHEFIYSTLFDVGVTDSYGNNSDQKSAKPGEKWLVQEHADGNSLDRSVVKAVSREEVEIKNELLKGSIDAHIYKQGKIVASRTGVSPEQKALFLMEPYIYVGLNSQVEEGDILSSAILSDINTRFSLWGINEAQLILTGGGVGPAATPYEFELVVLS